MEILARLNSGGMGEILLARKRGAYGFEKLVALKILRGDVARYEYMRTMFRDEARLVSRLDHPAIAQVYDFGEDQGVLFLAMEYVPGLELSTFLKMESQPPMPAGVCARLIAEAARGLHAAHTLCGPDGRPLGIVHRDISPQNLMLRFDGRVKVLDFGVALAKEREASTTQAGYMKGKLAYASPEQLLGRDTDRRTDVYSLAVVAHELLTKNPLFSAKASSLDSQSKRKNPPAPSKINPDVPPALDELVLKGLCLSPNGRFQDAQEMAVAMDKFAEAFGGELVDRFVERALGPEKAEHDEWMRKVTAGTALERFPSPDLVGTPPIGSSAIEAEWSGTPFPEQSAELPSLPPESASVPDSPWHDRSGISQSLLARAGLPTRRRSLLLALLLVTSLLAWTQLHQPTPMSSERPRMALASVPIPPPRDSDDSDLLAPELTAVLTVSDDAGAPNEVSESDASSPSETSESDEGTASSNDESEVSDADAGASPATESAPEAVEAEPVPEPAPEPVSRPEPTVTVQRTPSPRTRPSPKRARRRAPSKWGALTIDARKGGTIFVGGQVFGRTPLRHARIASGRHMVALRRPGDSAPRWQSWVVVRPGAHVRIRLR